MSDIEDKSKLATKAVVENQIKSLPKGSKKRTFLEKLLISLDNSAENISDGLGKMTHESTGLVGRIRKTTDLFRKNIQTTTTSAVSGIRGFGTTAVSTLTGASFFPDEISKPISSAVGSSVDTATAIVRNPLGAPFILANSMVSIIDKISPEFANKLDSQFKSVNVKNLENLPSKMMGSIKHLAFAADALLSVPFEIMSDLYNGLLDIMEAMADVIDGIVSAAIQLILNNTIYAILDSVLLEEIMTFLNEVGELASFVGDIANLAGGFSMITDITSQVTSYSDGLSDALSDPLQLASSYFPQLQQGLGFVGEITDTLRDPENLLKQYLPPQIGEQMKKISQLPGLGFVGDRGYGVGGILETLSDGVFTKAINNFSNQSPVLNGLFNKTSEPSENDFAKEPHEDGYQQGEYKPGSTVHVGGAEAVASTSKVLSEKPSESSISVSDSAVSKYQDVLKSSVSDKAMKQFGLDPTAAVPPVIKTEVITQGTTVDGQNFTVTTTNPAFMPRPM